MLNHFATGQRVFADCLRLRNGSHQIAPDDFDSFSRTAVSSKHCVGLST